MRLALARTKQPQQIRIPADLRLFLYEVARRIAAGDTATKVPSEDLLQSDFCYGGLVKTGSSDFAFTYFPEDTGDAEWSFHLSAKAITSVANGNTRSLELWGCDSSGCGSMFAEPDDVCLRCDCAEPPSTRPTRRLGVARVDDSLFPG